MRASHACLFPQAQNKVLGPLGLELEGIAIMWMLGTEQVLFVTEFSLQPTGLFKSICCLQTVVEVLMDLFVELFELLYSGE